MSDTSTIKAILLSASEVSQLLGVGKSLFYSMHSTGAFGPLPIRLGRRTLWRRQELEEWVAAGAPPRDQWLQIKEAEK